jgi:4-deoxy-L-threo-5-hexosulose-uronate ketol-isomerase
MELRTAASPKDVKHYTTDRLREEFLIDDLFQADDIKLVYSHIDRIITGSAVPVKGALKLTAGDELRAEYFLQRREMGVINIGGKGTITIDGTDYELEYKDGMYIGLGAKDITFASADASNPAKFYINSAPAHTSYPTVLIKPENCVRVELGSLETANHRTICKYILPGQVESCQLVMGMTQLKPGSVWNTMPCHTHDRRMEVYLYFDMQENDMVFHYMGEPTETRHIIMRNEQAVISPSWSIHSGCGTKAYTFIWGMVGENQDFDDMDAVALKDLM